MISQKDPTKPPILTSLEGKGNCLQLSLSVYLGIDVNYVPEFHKMPISEWKEKLVEWLDSMGFEFNEYFGIPTDGRKYLAVGNRHTGVTHCVVWQDNNFVYDCCADQRGLESYKKFWFLEPIPLADEAYYESVIQIANDSKFAEYLD